MKKQKTLLTAITTLIFPVSLLAAEVNITPEWESFDGIINGDKIHIQRNQDLLNTINPIYAKTSRPCPPFCVQPMSLGDGVETVGELDIFNALTRMTNGDSSIMLIDSRTPSWVLNGTIPGSVNVPWTRLNRQTGATADDILIALSVFWVKHKPEYDIDMVKQAVETDHAAETLDFSEAKTLVMFCNGIWCGQSPANIKTLLSLGYPAEKLKWYRGGMQDWESLGLTVARPLE